MSNKSVSSYRAVRWLVFWLVFWLAIGFIYQYVGYGDMSLTLVSTWMHILAWPVFLILDIITWSFKILLFVGICLLLGIGFWAFWDVTTKRSNKRGPAA